MSARKVVRLTLHTEEGGVVDQFLNTQPSRGRSQAIQLLIHLFVAEYGYREVSTVLGERLVSMGGHVHEQPAQPEQPQLHIQQVTHENVDTDTDTTTDTDTDTADTDVESDTAQSQADAAETATPVEALADEETVSTDPDADFDMEALFAQARKNKTSKKNA